MIVENITKPLIEWITISDNKPKKVEPVIKMSEIDRSKIENQDIVDCKINSGSILTNKSGVDGKDAAIDMTFESELNELDFQKFVDDLSMQEPEELQNLDDGFKTGTLRNRIRYEKDGRRERIIVDNMPNLLSDEITQLVKVKIIIPKRNKPIIVDTATFASQRLEFEPVQDVNNFPKIKTIEEFKNFYNVDEHDLNNIPEIKTIEQFKIIQKVDEHQNDLDRKDDSDKFEELQTRNQLERLEHLQKSNQVEINKESDNNALRQFRRPIMGKTALLQKQTNCVHDTTFDKKDSEIVRELVTSRFKDLLINYSEKTFQRQNSKICKTTSDVIKSENLEMNNNKDDADFVLESKINKKAVVVNEIFKHPETKNLYETKILSSNRGYQNSLSDQSRDSLDSDSDKTTGRLSKISTTDLQDISYEFDSVDLTEEINNIINKRSTNETSQFEDSLNSIGFPSIPSESLVEYDENQFLKDALGEELNLTTSIYDYNTNRNHSIGTSSISALISKENSRAHLDSYNGLEIGNFSSEVDKYCLQNQKLMKLIIESKIQNQIIAQTSKALSFCKNTQRFNCSPEYLEAERILLHTICKYNAIRDEIRQLEYEDIEKSGRNLGTVKITQMVFSTEILNPNYMAKKKRSDYNEWFVCVLTSGPNVIITKNVQADYDGLIRFLDEITFEKLNINFEINIAIYTIRIKNNQRFITYESKYHLDKEQSTMCPLSPTKMFANNKNYKKTLKSPPKSEYGNEPSAYDFSGHCVLHKDNLNNLGHYSLSAFSSATLQRNFVVDFATHVDILEKYAGFLDIGIETMESIVWNRRWCVLDGYSIRYFNYPGEHKPISCIDLRNTTSSQICKVRRQLCARPRTLYLELFKQKDAAYVSRNVIKHFLACDSKQELETWEFKLNNTLDALKFWNAMNYNKN